MRGANGTADGDNKLLCGLLEGGRVRREILWKKIDGYGNVHDNKELWGGNEL